MRYTYEFKKKAVELYRQGKWIDAPNDIINLKNFHDMIVRWHHLEESNTSDCLKHCGTNKKWSPEEKYELVARVIAGDTITSVSFYQADIFCSAFHIAAYFPPFASNSSWVPDSAILPSPITRI